MSSRQALCSLLILAELTGKKIGPQGTSGFTICFCGIVEFTVTEQVEPGHALPQLVLSVAVLTVTVIGPETPVVSSVDPQHPSLLASLQRDETSVLDLVMEDAKQLRRKGSADDQTRLDQYFESVRSVEQRLEAAMRSIYINRKKLLTR